MRISFAKGSRSKRPAPFFRCGGAMGNEVQEIMNIKKEMSTLFQSEDYTQ